MIYTVTKEIKEIAEIKNITVAEVLKTTKAEVNEISGDYTVFNRSNQNTILEELTKAKATAKAEAIQKERFSTYRWIKDDGEWLVAGDFTDKHVGDFITVVKASGEKQTKMITGFHKGHAEVK